MIAVDTNVLVYAHRRDVDFHANAAMRVKELAEGLATWAIPWPCIHEFYSVVTHPKVYVEPSTPEQALAQVDEWLASPSLALLAEPTDYISTLKPLLQYAHVSGPKVHDARIAAICLSHGVSELWTADRDFSRFAQLTTVNPLVGRGTD